MHYLGTHQVLQKVYQSYAQITAPMEKLLKKDVTFFWNGD